ncbi:hypothetical protein JUNP479_1138 [Aeromonas jandaei]|nr:hypothetical protein JUNP479_1138 [Aeromonas jandaei]
MYPLDTPHGGGMLRPAQWLGVFYTWSDDNLSAGLRAIIPVCPMSYPQLLGITQNAK